MSTHHKDTEINDNSTIHLPIPEHLADIAPYRPEQFKEKLEGLIAEPGFQHAIKFAMPGVDYDDFAAELRQLKSQDEFQRKVVGRFLEYLVQKTTAGLSVSGLENISAGTAYTFISNHRDIVLDASFLNLCLIRHNLPLTQVAIGNNLLIFDWIADLVKLNRSFIVKRDTGVREALLAAKQLSAYIHFAINQLKESVWIAQREGRAKDSNDQTQEALIKMLSLDGAGPVMNNLLDVNLVPVSISYEFDPNDYLKAREFLLKRRDPDFKKSQHDDLFSMETGILQYKGRVHFNLGVCINDALKAVDAQPDDRAAVVHEACQLIDRSIHRGYRLFPCNYIAYDQLTGSEAYKNEYTQADIDAFEAYLNKQLDKVDIADITPDERSFMRATILEMYANPLKNQLAAN